jgi:hypothetical protein
VLRSAITVMYAPSAAASDARSEAAGDAGTSSKLSDNADEAAPPVPEGLAGSYSGVYPLMLSPPAYVTVIAERSTKHTLGQNPHAVCKECAH